MQDILIVACSVHPRAALVELLESEGLSAVAVDSNTEAADLCQKLRPDVILVDVTIRDCENLDFLTKLRRAAPDGRIVAMTGAPDRELTGDGSYREIKTRILAAGADAIIAKPIQFDGLLALVRKTEVKPDGRSAWRHDNPGQFKCSRAAPP